MQSDKAIRAAVEDVKGQILADIAAGTVPNDVPDFSALHDYVDANCYGGFCDTGGPRDIMRGDWGTDDCNRVQTAVALWLIERRKVTAVHQYASGGTYTDTETTVSWLPGSSMLEVSVSMMPGLVYWTCPPPHILRKWVDALIKPHGYKRDGARLEMNGYFTTWKFRYYVKPAAGIASLD